MSTVTIQPPSVSEVTELMTDLFGLAVTEAKPPAAEIYSIAEFIDGSGSPVGHMAFDLGGGCRLGAALTQVPAGRVDEAVGEGAMPDNLAENLSEIFNICVNLIVPADGARVVLGKVAHGPSSENFAALKERLDAGSPAEFGFNVTRYGACRLLIGG